MTVTPCYCVCALLCVHARLCVCVLGWVVALSALSALASSLKQRCLIFFSIVSDVACESGCGKLVQTQTHTHTLAHVRAR